MMMRCKYGIGQLPAFVHVTCDLCSGYDPSSGYIVEHLSRILVYVDMN